MKSRLNIRIIFLPLIFISLLANFGFVDLAMAKSSASVFHADTHQQPKCWALDVGIILDMSGSMTDNDPDGYRFDAVKEVIDELIQNRQEECPEVVHRVGLITFSDDANIQMELTRIEIDQNTDPIEWSEAKFKKAIDGARSSLGGNTSFEEAFAKAKVLLDLPKLTEPVGYGSRRQLVIFVTDGQPTRGLTDSSSSLSTENLMCNWKKQITGDSFWVDKSIWILPLAAQSEYLKLRGCDGKSIHANFDDLVTAKGKGRLSDFGYSKQTIPLFVSELIANEFGRTTEKISCNAPFFVNPYSQRVELNFSAEKSDKPIQVTVTKLDDKTGEVLYTLRGGGWIGPDPERAMPINHPKPTDEKEEYTIFNPIPGKWKYDVEGMSNDECRGRVDGFKAEVVADVYFLGEGDTFPQVAEPPYYDPGSSAVPFVVQLRFNQQNNALGEERIVNEKNYPLDVEVTTILPDGTSILPNKQPIPVIKLTYSEKDEGWIYTVDNALLTPVTGTYKLLIVGTAKRADSAEDFELFRHEASFEVSKLERFQFAIQTPKQDDVLSCNAIQDGKSVTNPIPVVIQLQNNTGQPAQAIDYIPFNHDQSFIAELLDEDQKVIDSVPLKSEKNGIFFGSLLKEQSEILGCGKVTLRVRFMGEYNKEKFAISQNELEWTTNRVKSQGVLADVTSPKEKTTRFATAFDACLVETPQPVSIIFDLKDLEGNPVNVSNVSAGAENPFYQVRLKSPGSDVWQNLVVKSGPLPTQLVAIGGDDILKEGVYTYEILPVDGAFARGYVPAQTTITGTITRQDDFFTTPLACWASKSFVGILSVAFAVLIWFMSWGGPGGTLIFSDSSGEIARRKLSRLRFFTFMPHNANPVLQKKGIMKIKYEKSATPAPGVNVTLFLSDKTEYGLLIEANTDQFGPDDVKLEYVNTKASNSTNSSNGSSDFI